MPEAFVWYDLMTSNVADAGTFYAKVVDWTVIPSAIVEAGNYFVFGRDAYEFGGLMPIPEQARANNVKPYWSGYIAVRDVDAHAARIQKLGGSLIRAPWDIPGAGRFTVARDPFGAIFNVFTPTGHQGEGPNRGAHDTPGNIGWNELVGGDVDTSFPFYSELFGWQKTEELDLGDMGPYQMFGTESGVSIGAIMQCPDEAAPRVWNHYINVAAIDVAAQLITEHGGTITMGPHEVPGGRWILHARDPQGAAFALLAPNR